LKQKTLYTCQQCGLQSPKWLGRCPDCGQWGALVEETVTVTKGEESPRDGTRRAAAPDRCQRRGEERLASGYGEFDRVLGGGTVPGSFISSAATRHRQEHPAVAGRRALGNPRPVLYVTAEESARQVKLRAERLGVGSGELFLLAENAWKRC